jgi:hypothetical protein
LQFDEQSDGERVISTKLYWQPVRRVKQRTVGIGLRWALQSRYGQHFAAATMGSESVQFLEGLRASASSEDVRRDCKVLLEAIKEFGSVEVWIDE